MGQQEPDEGPPQVARRARFKRRHDIIARASEDFLDKPEQVTTVGRQLFQDLVSNTIPALHGKTVNHEEAAAWFANIPAERRLLIARGQHQALRAALTHVAFTEIARHALPLLEGTEPLIPHDQETVPHDAYVGDAIGTPYRGQYHQFMLAGVRWVQRPSFDFVDAIKRPDHPYHELFVATYAARCALRGIRGERHRERTHSGYPRSVRKAEDAASYRPSFLGNLQDIMITLVAAQKAYIATAEKDGKRALLDPHLVARFVLNNLDTFSLPARMKRDAALKKISHPTVRYVSRPMDEKPFAAMPSIFVAVGDSPDLRLEPVPDLMYLKSSHPSFCAGIVPHRSPDLSTRRVVETVLAAAGVPSGRSPHSPDYGRIDPLTILAIIGTRIAEDTIFREHPFP
jgi:hypothetical protein